MCALYLRSLEQLSLRSSFVEISGDIYFPVIVCCSKSHQWKSYITRLFSGGIHIPTTSIQEGFNCLVKRRSMLLANPIFSKVFHGMHCNRDKACQVVFSIRFKDECVLVFSFVCDDFFWRKKILTQSSLTLTGNVLLELCRFFKWHQKRSY